MKKEKCNQDKCSYEGGMIRYVKFFRVESTNEINWHYGSDCPKCDKWQGWIKQDDSILEKRFYEPNNNQIELL
mgnify:CR=1 FL=1|jgi:hypothetical protein|tara:strand:+ start:277 stop:495 length:219 start_codon:yes stop_codon:yes gene_type:complete